MDSWFERVISHTGTEIPQTPTGGSSEEYCAMGESLTQQRRVGDEVLWSVNPCKWGRRIDIRIGCLFDGTRRVSSG